MHKARDAGRVAIGVKIVSDTLFHYLVPFLRFEASDDPPYLFLFVGRSRIRASVQTNQQIFQCGKRYFNSMVGYQRQRIKPQILIVRKNPFANQLIDHTTRIRIKIKISP